ncbi:tetratricopeptide repeat protein [Flavobacterium antarcticum]|uniref:tetratricopeptide repeat protein n=1 Tax=Flavobacterium antarcticum TaxID=271155 RepID=UPI0003B7ABA1|nr:tetratricopeptide repeat protein [Flavobacterium antarcticum]
MKRLSFLIILLISITAFSQVTKEDKPVNGVENNVLKESFSKEKALAENVAISCTCIDSISIQNKNAKETAVEVKHCIDKQVVGYQTTVKIGELLNSVQENVGSMKEGENLEITLANNPDSEDFKKYYYEIERELMATCPAIKSVTAMNNKEGQKSVSTNSLAIAEYNKGNAFIRENNYEKALPFYQRAVLFDPEFVFAWDNIGICNRKLGNFDEALKAYKTSLKLDPKGITALQNLPVVYISKKNYKKAIESYGELEKVEPDNPEVFYGKGVVYYQNLKDYEKALDNICKAYNLYISHNSPYRTDAEKLIQNLYNEFKAKDQIAKFDTILKANNISQN